MQQVARPISIQQQEGATIRTATSGVLIVFLRRLWLPVLFFTAFIVLCVLVYSSFEGIRWQDALFWIFHPHAIHYDKVKDATKYFALFVFLGVFAFQIWIAERVLATIFRRQGRGPGS